MTTQAEIARLIALRADMTNLLNARRNAEMSDDMAFTNGSLSKIDADIAGKLMQIQKWYADHEFKARVGDAILSFWRTPHGDFVAETRDLSKAGTIKKIAVHLTKEQLEVLIGYLGGGTVTLDGKERDIRDAFAKVLEERNEAENMSRKLTREKQDLEMTILTLQGELAALHNDRASQ